MSSEWPEVTLESIKANTKSAFAMGPFGSNIKAENFTTSGVPVIKGGNLGGTYLDESKFDYLTQEKADQLSSSKARRLDLVVTHRGTLGQVGLIPETSKFSEYVVSQSQLKMSFDCSVVDPYFVYYFFKSKLGQTRLLANTSQVGVPAIAQALTTLKQLKIPLPQLDVQKSIVDFLRLVDDRITLLRETNQTLEAIAQALFKSWFVDFDPVRAKAQGKLPEGMDAATAALFPDTFDESELGLVPKGWRVTAVGDVVNVTDYVANGSFAALKDNVTLLDSPSYALYVRTTDYNSGFSGGYRYVDKSAYDFLSKSALIGDEVIISNVGDVGTVFRPPSWLEMPMTLGSNAVALKKPDMSAYLYFHFSGRLGQHDIQSIVTGSAQLKFNKTNFRALRLLIPDEKCLAHFENIANLMLSRIEINLSQIQGLTSIRDTLLPRLISGQLRIRIAETELEKAMA